VCLVILGWSSEIFDIIDELIIANESQRNPSIVILTSKFRGEIQYMIKNKINNLKNTRIIYRNGDPMLVCKKCKKLSFLNNAHLPIVRVLRRIKISPSSSDNLKNIFQMF